MGTNSTAYDDDRRHVFHSWSAQATLAPLVVNRAEGSHFWDSSGKRYLDFSSQLVNANIGHQHPRVVEAIIEQARKLTTIAPFHANETRSEAARLIAAHAPGDLDMVFFTNGGAEATENAIRMARLTTGRHKILTTYRSYHGATGGSIVLTGEPRRWPSEPGIAGVVHFHGPYPYRSAFYADSVEQEGERALAHLADTIMLEGPSTIAAVLLETVVGTNGILVPPDGYLAGVRELCDQHGILLILDEVMAGFGRCGEWFAADHWGVVPDLICFAKGVNSGYVPLGGVILSPQVAETFATRPYPGGLTYSGHPLACAAAVGSIRAFEEEGIVEHARMLGTDIIGPELAKLAANHPSVGEVRGLGVFWAIELVRDRETRAPLVPFNAAGPDAAPMAAIAAACKERGLWPFTHFNRVHVVPPCTITADDLREGLAILDEALTVADSFTTA
ncbi:aspartate aminotransferase family protein [Frankia sp. CNm7]|uniref:Aspartate aminotransferase family protein n=1 Tax=Frankia nepalensis TaxID=1836974 RepID=A0A937UTW7_9ACTN|nr:aspartate aminotransferase family protein [Frankia nepalensis]MBL7497247.1 aspartate aminotransferase family protein [Frankia nepalensis]MBL7512949.1 aspartate aminotransferase family protein [Frankia nepalensis]MBL7519192.1 aspartate aminotransferase family protein [Frankia nepalensis]MBL7633493.1 aspartate aminotransferase family protein [Frankia nepalensis]